MISVNHTRFPKEDHLPDWVHWDNKHTKGERVEYQDSEGIPGKSQHGGDQPLALFIYACVDKNFATPSNKIHP